MLVLGKTTRVWYLYLIVSKYRIDVKCSSKNLLYICVSLYTDYAKPSHLIWMGDLNYRIETLPESEVKTMLENNDMQLLLNFDQVRGTSYI